jgi:hypothetical protein
MQLGQDVAPAGDVNRDGYGDLLIGAPGVAGGRGAVIVLYGAPVAADVRIRPGERFGGRLVRAPSGRKGFGYAVARLGRGFVAGAPAAPLRGFHGRGGAWILPSRSARAIRIEGPRSGGPAGTAVSATAEGRRVLVLTRSRSLRPARALLYSRRGKLLVVYRGLRNAREARIAGAGAGDLTGDGRGDLILGSPGTARAYVIAGGP